MREAVTGPLFFFLASAVFGAGLLLFYDVLQGFRRVFVHSSLFRILEDLCYWMMVGILSFLFLYHYNQGEIRGFFFLGIGIGMAFYYMRVHAKMVGIFQKGFQTVGKGCKIIAALFGAPFRRIRIFWRWKLKNEKKNIKMALKNKRGDSREGSKKI
jgi:spore cortex biosynthesis protein YabQ